MAFKMKPTVLQKLARKQRHPDSYPIATVAFYGPDDRRATKVAVSIIATQGAAPTVIERWHADASDARYDPGLALKIVAFLRTHSVRRVAMMDRIIGCPHEEGVDYPEGEACPQCPFWHGRDRWTGETVH